MQAFTLGDGLSIKNLPAMHEEQFVVEVEHTAQGEIHEVQTPVERANPALHLVGSRVGFWHRSTVVSPLVQSPRNPVSPMIP